jgi:hypothetical protein
MPKEVAMQKRLLVPSRVRRVPPQFSWVDQRLVRDKHVVGCDPEALALYRFLVTVADAQGLSFYADGSIARLLSLSLQRLAQARQGLLRAGLIAYEAPLYQVLALEPRCSPSPPASPTPSPRSTRPEGHIRALRQALRQPLEADPP